MIGKICILLLASAFVHTSTPKDITIPNSQSMFPCSGFNYASNLFYFFGPMVSKTDYSTAVTITDYVTAGDSWTGTAIFNVCTSVAPDADCAEASAPGSIGFLKLYDANKTLKCAPLSVLQSQVQSTSTDFTTWAIEPVSNNASNKVDWSIQVASNPAATNLAVGFTFECGTDSLLNSISAIVGAAAPGQSRKLTIQGSSSFACGVDGGRFVNFLKKNIAVPIVMCLVAVFLMVFGQRFISKVLVTVAFILGFVSVLAIGIGFRNPYTWSAGFSAAVVGVALIVGIILGLFALFWSKYALVIGGGFGGYIVSFKLFELVNLLAKTVISDKLQLALVILLVLIGAYLGFRLKDHIMIFACSFGGAFLLTLGVGSILKNYPDLENAEYYIRLNAWKSVQTEFYVYFAAMIFFGIVGTVIQYRHRAEKKAAGEPEFGASIAHEGYYNQNSNGNGQYM